MKRLIPNISKMAMGGEPPKGIKPPVRDTMFVSDLKDPRLKSYQDSARLSRNPIPKNAYNIRPYKPNITGYAVSSTNGLDNFDSKKNKDVFAKNKIKPFREYNIRENVPAVYIDGQYVPAQKNAEIKMFEYKKPVQPVAYRPKVTPTVSNKKIQMETTKIDTTPVVQPTPKTPPTPLTKKQYYEVPDVNGKITLLTPEQFSRMSSGNKNDLMSKSPIMNKPKYFYEMNSSGKRQLVPENKIREYMQTKNK